MQIELDDYFFSDEHKREYVLDGRTPKQSASWLSAAVAEKHRTGKISASLYR